MRTEAGERIAVAPPERLFTTLLMAMVAVVANGVKPTRDDVRSHIERSADPYFRAFLAKCMRRVTSDE